MQDAYKSIHTPKWLRDLFDETVSFQVAASFDANAVCTTAYKSTVSGRIEQDHEKLYVVKISISKSSVPLWQQSLHLMKVIQTKGKDTVEKYKIFTLPNLATPTEQYVCCILMNCSPWLCVENPLQYKTEHCVLHLEYSMDSLLSVRQTYHPADTGLTA